jgi:hypothetical protein
MRFRFFALLVVLFLFGGALTGCVTTPAVKVEYKNVLITPDDADLVNCKVTRPPAQQKYLNASDKEKEKMLMDLSLSQTANLDECNKRLGGIRTWKKEQIQIYTAPPK